MLLGPPDAGRPACRRRLPGGTGRCPEPARGSGPLATSGRSQLDVESFHVGEFHPEAVCPGVVRAEVHLREAVGRNLLELLLVGSLLVDGEQAVVVLGRQGLGDGATPVLGRLQSRGEVHAVFYLTPGGRLGLTALSVEQADALAAHLAGLGHSPSNVIADRDTADAFAESWQRHTSAAPVPPFWRTHLYRLGTLTPPQPRPEDRGASRAGRTVSKSCTGALSSVSTSGSSPPST